MPFSTASSMLRHRISSALQNPRRSIICFLTIVILGVGLNAKPDLTIETWAHQKALERLEAEKLSLSGSADSE
ncbi:hypothetical protein OIU76_010373 [Salix suchowensis]|nr:hypothetical protein OIU76_010373 [Salix suchowensis]